MGDVNSDDLKKILSIKYIECNRVIKKLKIKNNRLKAIYGIIIFFLLAGQSTVAAISSFTIPPFIVPIISGSTAFLTAISTAFKIKDTRKNIVAKVEELKKLKSYIETIDLPLEDEDRKIKLTEIVNTLI